MAIDLSNYEDVATLNKWFVSNYPMGSLQIIDKDHKLILNKEGQVIDEIFIATTGVFRDVNDVHPAVMNVARGRQSEYPKHMQRFFAEDVTTSSYGRCLALLKATDKTATQDDMRKVDEYRPKYSAPGSKSAAMEMALHIVEQKSKTNTESIPPVEWSVGEAIAQIGEVVDVSFTCSHGDMVKKEGISKSNQKPYAGYVCPAPKGDQCSPRWAKLTAAGTWYWPDDSEPGKGGE
jgi:hypothetical protein